MVFVEHLRLSASLCYLVPSSKDASWRSLEPPSVAIGYESSAVSEASTDSRRLRYDGIYARLRGESLRCLSLIIRSVPYHFAGRWCELVVDGPNTPGLATIVRIDECVHARRFAMFAMVGLLKSFRVPSTKRNMITRNVVSDTTEAFPQIVEALSSLLHSSHPEDRNTVCRVIGEIVSCACWSQIANKDQLVDSLFLSVVKACRKTKETSELLTLLSVLEKLADISPITVQTQEATKELLSFFHYSELLPAVRIYLVEPMAAFLEADDSASAVPHIVRECIRLIAHDTSFEIQAEVVKSVFRNLWRLDSLTTETVEELVRISLKLASEEREEFIAGLGKLSRRSENVCICIFTGMNLIDFFTHPSPVSIKGIGDLVFSAIIWKVHSDQLTGLIDSVVQLFTTANRGFCLRAIMTGLSRLRDAGEDHTMNNTLLHITNPTMEFLCDLWTEFSCEERLAADSLRTVGLLSCVVPFDSRFQSISTTALSKGLLSRKTQRVLSSLASLQFMQSNADKTLLALVPEVLNEYLAELADRTVWDYASSDSIAGSLHIVRSAWMHLDSRGLNQPRPDLVDRVRIVAECVQRYRVFQYNKSIPESLECIQRLVCSAA